MKILGFAKYVNGYDSYFTKDKIYPYYEIQGPDRDGDYEIKIKDDDGDFYSWWITPHEDHLFDFYHYPEFPENVSEWTEDDWFQYDLKYGE